MAKAKFLSKRPDKAALSSYMCSKTGAARKPVHSHRPSPLVDRVQELETELELLTSYSSDTIYRLRYEDMSYDYISNSVTRLLGFSAQEMKKINFRSLILETRIVTDGMKTVGSFEDLEKKRRSGDVNKWEADYLIRTKDGRKIWVADVSYPWFDETGNIIGSIGSLRDITDRITVENEIKEELSKIANTDALTGLSNRRQFFDMLEYEIKRMHRTNNDLSILLIDIDYFKSINDNYGHDVGDMVLVEVAAIIRSCLRDTDVASRIGGEEFAVFLRDTCSNGAYFVAERIRKTIQMHTFCSGSDNKPLGCTVSIGIASAIMGDDVDSTMLYKTADTRLYIAKNTGRNQVSVDEILHTH